MFTPPYENTDLWFG